MAGTPSIPSTKPKQCIHHPTIRTVMEQAQLLTVVRKFDSDVRGESMQ
jgi:hypothetical protein